MKTKVLESLKEYTSKKDKTTKRIKIAIPGGKDNYIYENSYNVKKLKSLKPGDIIEVSLNEFGFYQLDEICDYSEDSIDISEQDMPSPIQVEKQIELACGVLKGVKRELAGEFSEETIQKTATGIYIFLTKFISIK